MITSLPTLGNFFCDRYILTGTRSLALEGSRYGRNDYALNEHELFSATVRRQFKVVGVSPDDRSDVG